MSEQRYPIPAARYRCEFVDRRSRFIATVDCTPTVAAARAFIGEMKAEMRDATHHVHAFAVGFGQTVTMGMTDGGEPSGTAGRPTLAVVQGSGLGDVCVVTARYFGGTKLGTGGLVRAYSRAAEEALAGVRRTERAARLTIAISAPYALYQQVRQLLDGHGASLEAEEFSDVVTVTARVDLDRLPLLESALADETSGIVKALRIDG